MRDGLDFPQFMLEYLDGESARQRIGIPNRNDPVVWELGSETQTHGCWLTEPS